MMAIADQQNRRRARHQQYQSEQARNLAGLIGAVDDVGEEADTDAMEKAKAEALASDTGARKTQAEAALLRAKTAAGVNADSVLRKKTESEAKAEEKETVLRKKESGDVLRSRIMAGDQFKPDIPTIDDPALGGLDDTSLESVTREATGAKAEKETKDAEDKRKADAKIAADEALAAQRDAAAAKLLRVPTGGKGAKAVDPEIAAAKKRSVLAQAKKDEADAKKAERDAAGDGKPPKPMLTPAEVEGVVELQGARDMLGRLEKMKKSGGAKGAAINTGPLEALGSWFASKVGVESPEKTEFKALAGEQIAGYIKNISGATVSEPERKSLLENIPSASDDDEEFLAKLKTVKDTLDAKLRLKEKAFSATGRDTSIFAGGAPAAPMKPADMSDADIEARLKELKAKR
jgi:hypothetical protein